MDHTQNLNENPLQQRNNKKNVLFLIATLIIGALVLITLFSLLSPSQSNFFKDQLERIQSIIIPKNPGKIIAKVGKEQIYQQDLDRELQYMPPLKNTDMKQFLLDKLIRDSLILQGAADDKLIALNDSVFNALDKDYSTRISLIKNAEEKVSNASDSITGTVITVWFFNNDTVGPLGYEKSKELAFQKIMALYTDVKNGKLTIAQAAEKNSNDTTLAQLDKGYKNNAFYTFDVKKGEKIIFDDAFNKTIWSLKEGELSPVTVLIDSNTYKGPMEALYAFAQVEKRSDTNNLPFDSWLQTKKPNYEVIIY